MEKSELKDIIKEAVSECLQEVNSEKTRGNKPIMAIGAPGSAKRNMSIADPTREEMLAFLESQFGREQGWEDDAEAAMYWFANFNHGGQWSNLYSALSTSPFRPGPIARGPQKDSMEEDMFNALESEYGQPLQRGEPDIQERNVGSVKEMTGTAAVQGYAAPMGLKGPVPAKPVKHPKDVPAHRANEGTEEDDDPLFVEYHSQRQGERPFMLHGEKFEYVNAKYPDGKIDIAVYAFSGDVTYGYKVWRNMHNLHEGVNDSVQNLEEWKQDTEMTPVPKLQELLKRKF